MGQINKFIQGELNNMGLMMNNNEREILVFGKTDTCKTALEGKMLELTMHYRPSVVLAFLFSYG